MMRYYSDFVFLIMCIAEDKMLIPNYDLAPPKTHYKQWTRMGMGRQEYKGDWTL